MSQILEKLELFTSEELETFQDICPIWSQKFADGNLEVQSNADLGNSMNCVVAEAWKNKDGSCGDCARYKNTIWGKAVTEPMWLRQYKMNKEVVSEVKGFLHHYQDNHRC